MARSARTGGRPGPTPWADPATVPFAAVPRQRAEPLTERMPVVVPEPEPEPAPPAAADGLLVVLPDLEVSQVPDIAEPSGTSRPTPLVVPGQPGPQRKPTRRPVVVIGSCLAMGVLGLTAVTGVISALTPDDPVAPPAGAAITAPTSTAGTPTPAP